MEVDCCTRIVGVSASCYPVYEPRTGHSGHIGQSALIYSMHRVPIFTFVLTVNACLIIPY